MPVHRPPGSRHGGSCPSIRLQQAGSKNKPAARRHLQLTQHLCSNSMRQPHGCQAEADRRHLQELGCDLGACNREGAGPQRSFPRRGRGRCNIRLPAREAGSIAAVDPLLPLQMPAPAASASNAAAHPPK
jgi:hypothetical protein